MKDINIDVSDLKPGFSIEIEQLKRQAEEAKSKEAEVSFEDKVERRQKVYEVVEEI